MKNFILLLIVAATLVMPGLSQAEDICITVGAADWDRFKTAFIATYPNTECLRYDLTTIECLEMKYTDDEWVHESTRRFAYGAFRTGEEAIAKNTAIQNMAKDFDTKVQLKTISVTPIAK